MRDITQAILDNCHARIKKAYSITPVKSIGEGGCGVIGFATNIPVCGRHIFEPSIQMHNRGNGKGGGIAAAGLIPSQLGVDNNILKNYYILQIALLEPKSKDEIEKTCIIPFFNIKHKNYIKPKNDWRALNLKVKPPDIARYFVRVKENILKKFAQKLKIKNYSYREIEDEFIQQNSIRLNNIYYNALDNKQAFVISHARDLIILKIVGYAEQVIQYYNMNDFKAHLWIAHQRYPTKGYVWHPGGSHPFIGMNEALVHNGDFANYHSISEYLYQYGIKTQFLTDTEVSVQLFDLWRRVYRYPLEYVIEAMAPTTELDFERLDSAKQLIYKTIQSQHIHGSPDGPWFFIIASSSPDQNKYQLIGITDTAMLRPQVFALMEGKINIGLVGSEKQAINATLSTLHKEDSRFRQIADHYWNARGGSSTDGGAFIFTVQKNTQQPTLTCTNKFNRLVFNSTKYAKFGTIGKSFSPVKSIKLIQLKHNVFSNPSGEVFKQVCSVISSWSPSTLIWFLNKVVKIGSRNDNNLAWGLKLFTKLYDRRYDYGQMRRSEVLASIQNAINILLDSSPLIEAKAKRRYARINWKNRNELRAPDKNEKILIVQANNFLSEGNNSDAQLEILAYKLGWQNFIIYGLKGQRFHGCGLGENTQDVHIDIYGNSGDYLASGIDGLTIIVHGDAQDQIAQIIKQGRLVVYGNVGQTFMYGAKGGEVYILGNGAGRPLINAVGRPKVIINGTCLDFLAESFMAGNPLENGGFIILNSINFDDKGKIQALSIPYSGNNIFSLASGGVIYIRDPHQQLVKQQLNGGQYCDLTEKDWYLIYPYLKTNEKLFGISIEKDLLAINGKKCLPQEVYRKIKPS